MDGDHMKYLNQGELAYQGAESRLYRTTLFSSNIPCIVKERFVKRYRHETLDSVLSIQRMRAEVRHLTRCRELGIMVPPILLVDIKSRRIWLGEIGPNASTLKEWFESQKQENITEFKQTFLAIFKKLGHLLAKLHANHIIHGDLTMANILVQMVDNTLVNQPDFDLIPIDFGLSSTVAGASQRLLEDKAVDLYVFERALNCGMDPDVRLKFEQITSDDALPNSPIEYVVKSYQEYYLTEVIKRENRIQSQMKVNSKSSRYDCKTIGELEIKDILKRLDEVRLRGRKRSMVG